MTVSHVHISVDNFYQREMREKGWMKKMKSKGFEDHTKRVSAYFFSPRLCLKHLYFLDG